MPGNENRSFDEPDESRAPDKTRVDVVHVGDAEVGRFTFEFKSAGTYARCWVEPAETPAHVLRVVDSHILTMAR